MRKSAAALLLASRVGQRFDGIVTGASQKGTWVRILRPPAEGHVVRGEDGLDVGDRVRVELIHTDVVRASSTSPAADGPCHRGRLLKSSCRRPDECTTD